MPRGPRLDYPNALHHVVVRGIERRYIFDDDIDKDFFLDWFGETLTRTNCSCYAWCLMGNHGHFLIRSGPRGLAPLMQSVLTRYARWYNRSRHRAGHLFQNRYNSSLIYEDPYFLNAVRYIHFNPLRARMLKSLKGLATYAWTGHSTLLGHQDRPWQDTSYVLSCFGGEPRSATEGYLKFMTAGLKMSPEQIEKGDLLASFGGLVKRNELRRQAENRLFDRRALGDKLFVENALQKANRAMDFQTTAKLHGFTSRKLLLRVTEHYKLALEDASLKGRSNTLSVARSVFAYLASQVFLFPRSEIQSLLKVTNPTVTKLIRRAHLLPDFKTLDPTTFLPG